MSEISPLSRQADGEVVETNWGYLVWKISAESFPGSETTFGTCHIEPGHRNSLHSHPNCEEVLYVVPGHCEHKLGDNLLLLGPGDAFRIPKGVRHWAKCKGDEPLKALIFFSSGHRQAENHEGTSEA